MYVANGGVRSPCRRLCHPNVAGADAGSMHGPDGLYDLYRLLTVSSLRALMCGSSALRVASESRVRKGALDEMSWIDNGFSPQALGGVDGELDPDL